MFDFRPIQALVVLIAAFLVLLPSIFYVLTLYRALSRCAPESRAMQPALVWLLYVPFFNIVWHFIVVVLLAKSLRSEFQRRGVAETVDTGQKLGLTMNILMCLSFIPVLGILCCIAALICWILYWMKISRLSGRIAQPRVAAPAMG